MPTSPALHLAVAPVASLSPRCPTPRTRTCSSMTPGGLLWHALAFDLATPLGRRRIRSHNRLAARKRAAARLDAFALHAVLARLVALRWHATSRAPAFLLELATALGFFGVRLRNRFAASVIAPAHLDAVAFRAVVTTGIAVSARSGRPRGCGRWRRGRRVRRLAWRRRVDVVRRALAADDDQARKHDGSLEHH